MSTWVNGEALALSGWSSSKMIGQNHNKIINIFQWNVDFFTNPIINISIEEDEDYLFFNALAQKTSVSALTFVDKYFLRKVMIGFI